MTTQEAIAAVRSAASFEAACETLRLVHEAVNRRERPLSDYIDVHDAWQPLWGEEAARRRKALQCQHLMTPSNFTGD